MEQTKQEPPRPLIIPERNPQPPRRCIDQDGTRLVLLMIQPNTGRARYAKETNTP